MCVPISSLIKINFFKLNMLVSKTNIKRLLQLKSVEKPTFKKILVGIFQFISFFFSIFFWAPKSVVQWARRSQPCLGCSGPIWGAEVMAVRMAQVRPKGWAEAGAG